MPRRLAWPTRFLANVSLAVQRPNQVAPESVHADAEKHPLAPPRQQADPAHQLATQALQTRQAGSVEPSQPRTASLRSISVRDEKSVWKVLA